MTKNQEVQKTDLVSNMREILDSDNKGVTGYLAWDAGMIKCQIVKALETGGIPKAQRYINHIKKDIGLILQESTLKSVFELLEINESEA